MKNDIKFYFSVFLRKIHYFLVIFGVVAVASITIAKLLPPVYVASTRLLVDASRIPSQLAASTVQTAARAELQIIEQRLMTRVNMLNIARDLRVFPDIGKMSADEIVTQMRDNTFISSSAGSGKATLMNITYEASTGTAAANVVHEYVTVILRDNAETRADQAGQTLDFFDIEVEHLNRELEKQNALILTFNTENSDALPQTLNYRLSQNTTLETRLASTEQEIRALKEQKRRLINIFETTGTLGNPQSVQLSPDQQRLANLREELLRALTIYSAENPKIKLLKATIAQQEALVGRNAGLDSGETISISAILDIQLSDIDARIEILNNQREINISQLAELQDSIERTPAIQIAQDSLQRDFQNIQSQYNAAVDRQSKAATGERIELLDRGHRIAVIDPATVPTAPDRPNRSLIAIGGSAFGALLGLLAIFGMEFLNSAIRRPTDIIKGLGITPIVTVPYVRTPMELVVRRAAFIAAILVVVVGLPAALFAIDTYYLPLDLIFDKVSNKLGSLL